MNLELEGKHVFISASGRGIGKAAAHAFLEEGAWVVINDHDAELLHRTHAEFRARFHDRVESFVGDMSDESVMTLLEKFLERLGRSPDVLVANLGSGKPQHADKLARSEWERFFQINVYSTLLLIRTFLRSFEKKKNGVIVVTSSIAGLERTRAPAGYAAAKAALLTLVKNLSPELARSGIRINAVVPGNIHFPGGRWEEILRERRSEVEAYLKNEVPMQRLGTPQEVAAAVLFLASPRASFITGTHLIVDGGETRSYT